METSMDNAKLEALRLAVGRHPKLMKSDGTTVTTSAEDVVKDADAFHKFLKGG